MKKPVFATKTGWLTAYALHCGYLQINENRERLHLDLYHNGGLGYDVKLYCHEDHKLIFWDTFEKLSDAKMRFSLACRVHSLTRKRALP